MKGILCKAIEKAGELYYGVAMSIPVATAKRPGRKLDRGFEFIVIAPDFEALEHAKKLLQGDICEPLEADKCHRVYVGKVE